jgi:surface protein
MYETFYQCNNVTDIDVSGFNTSNVWTMYRMFYMCSKVTELDISGFDFSKTTNVNDMFYGCSKLTQLDLSNFNPPTNQLFNTFGGCGVTKIDLSSYRPETFTQLYTTFNGCSKVTEILIPNINTRNATNFTYAFNQCRELVTIVGNLDLYSATSSGGAMFTGCKALKNVTLSNIKNSNFVLGNTGSSASSYGENISLDSLIRVAKELWDNTGLKTYSLRLSTPSKDLLANVYVKLVDVTDEMLAQDEFAANKKPCVVCESTDEGAMLITEYIMSKNWTIA